KPPESIPGAPVISSAPTSSSPASSARVSASFRPARTSGDSAFAFPFEIVACAMRSRTSYCTSSTAIPLEQLGSLAGDGGRVQTDVRETGGGRDPSAGRALDQSALQEEGLVHVLDRFRSLAHGNRERAESDRAADEGTAQRIEDRPVDLVEAELVDVEQR